MFDQRSHILKKQAKSLQIVQLFANFQKLKLQLLKSFRNYPVPLVNGYSMLMKINDELMLIVRTHESHAWFLIVHKSPYAYHFFLNGILEQNQRAILLAID